MNCSQCGAPIEDGLKFCTQCGARIDIVEELIEEMPKDENKADEKDNEIRDAITQENQGDTIKYQVNEEENVKREKEITRPIAKSKPKKREAQTTYISQQQTQYAIENGNMNRHVGIGKRYEWEGRKGISGFAETLLAVIINPVASGEELYLRLSKKATLIYMAAIILISSCMSYLMFISLSSKVAQLFYNAFDYFFGYGTVQYLLDEISVQVLLLSILSDVLLIAYITLIVIVVYKILLKLDIEWIECVQLMIMPMVIDLFGKVITFCIAMISIKAGLFCAGILLILIVVLSIVQFINRLGLSAITVYSIPPIYVVSSLARIALIFQIIKGYIN